MYRMEKVKISKLLVEGIKSIQACYKSGIEFDIEALGNEQAANCAGIKVVYDFVHVSRENMRLYFSALVNGYEVEETPEDKVKNYFKSIAISHSDDQYVVGFNLGARKAIIETLNLLNIKIDGIN